MKFKVRLFDIYLKWELVWSFSHQSHFIPNIMKIRFEVGDTKHGEDLKGKYELQPACSVYTHRKKYYYYYYYYNICYFPFTTLSF